jgi:hypothetical protein
MGSGLCGYVLIHRQWLAVRREGSSMLSGASEETDEKAAVLAAVCDALADGQTGDAAALLGARYPFTPLSNAGRKFSKKQCMAVFLRDGFTDRYSGRRLVFPGTLRLLSRLLPREFPYHANWKTDACHFAFWELFPTIDHLEPVSRGGVDDESNWVSTSMLLNSAKANFRLEELGWRLHPPSDLRAWDGLATWFLNETEKNTFLLESGYLRDWHKAAATEPLGRPEGIR